MGKVTRVQHRAKKENDEGEMHRRICYVDLKTKNLKHTNIQ